MIVCPVCRSDAAVEQTCVAILSGRDTNRTRCRRCGARGTVADWEDAAGRSDIAKCAGNGCPIRERCDRFVRPAVDGQAWCVPTLRRVDRETAIALGGEWWVCDGFVPATVRAHGGAVEEGDGA